MFNIELEPKSARLYGESTHFGKIIINNFSETITLPLTYWNVNNYKKSWFDSITEGLENKEHAALAVSMYELTQTNFLMIWVIYFEDEIAYIQNEILFLEEHPEFSIERINNFIGQRQTHNEEGNRISEWSTDIKSIIAFRDQLKLDLNII